MKWIPRLALMLVLVAIATAGACRLLPARFAVNVPIANGLFGIPGDAPDETATRRLQPPEGYSVSVFAAVPNPRLLLFTSAGDLLVSSPRSDSVWRLSPDRDGDGRADSATPLALELDRPHGIDLFDGQLYVAEGSRISRVSFDVTRGEPSGPLEVVVAELPDGGNHWTRTVGIGPDERLYVTVGSTCNVCIEKDERRAAMLRYELDGSGYEVYASGLRNAVDFAWQPGTDTLYATDNGRDLLGEDTPPEELNRVVRGGFYGWPYRTGYNVADPDYGGRQPELEARALAPAHPFPAHNAPLGIHFVDGPASPDAFRNSALVALHGSWNRRVKDGYRVVSLHWNGAGEIEQRDFLTGFEVDDDVIGRPVDVALGPDGAFYVSDDYAAVVWRVSRGEAPKTGAATRSPQGLPGQTRELRLDPGQVAEGERLYEAHACMGCHEVDPAEPGVVVTPLSGLAARYDSASLAAFFNAPTPPMPRFELSSADRAALAAYLLKQHGG